MTCCTKYNRKTGQWEVVPPPAIDPMAWPFIIFFGLLGIGVAFACVAGWWVILTGRL